MDARMRSQPLLDRAAGVTGEIVVDQVEVADRVRCVNGIEELQEAGRIPGRGGEGERLPVAGTQGPIDPDLVGTTAVVEGSLDAMAIRRPAGSGREGARAHGSEFVEAEDRRSLRWVDVESDDPRSFGTNSGSVLSAQLRGWRHRIPSWRRIRRI